MSTKPIYTPYLKEILAYEIPSSTEWNLGAHPPFRPNFYVDIQSWIEEKISLCKIYSEEMSEFPHPRSPQGLEVLARKRGMEVGLESAEAFWICRKID